MVNLSNIKTDQSGRKKSIDTISKLDDQALALLAKLVEKNGPAYANSKLKSSFSTINMFF